MPTNIVLKPSGSIFGEAGQGGTYDGGVLFDLDAGKERVLPFEVETMNPNFGLDSQGNIYVCAGTGTEPDAIYKVTQSGQSTLLYTFTDGSECFGVTADGAGDVYGVTLNGPAPQGQVFRLIAAGEFTSLYIFSGGSDGGLPNDQLTLDRQGNVYGTTFYGGTGGGVIFRVSSGGVETVLHTFVPETGAQPNAGVTLNSSGNLYGAASIGPNGEGTIYQLSPGGQFTVLYAFTGKNDGGQPATNVALDSAGNIYGTTALAGDMSCAPSPGGAAVGCGVVSQLSPAGSYSVLHSFMSGADDGAAPSSAPVLDMQGNVYGATSSGGVSGYGVIYEIMPQPTKGSAERAELVQAASKSTHWNGDRVHCVRLRINYRDRDGIPGDHRAVWRAQEAERADVRKRRNGGSKAICLTESDVGDDRNACLRPIQNKHLTA